MSAPPRPDGTFDPGLQHERTALAWERTAISIMVSGVLLARFAASDGVMVVAGIGLAQTAFGGAALVWAAWHYDDLHGRIRAGESLVHPSAARVVGLATVAFSLVALVFAISSALG